MVYELWTPSFQDSSQPPDGLGDLQGVRRRLNDLRKIGVSTILLRPFLSTEDTGLGVENFVALEKGSGKLKDALELIGAAHAREMRVVIDFPLAVTSVSHKWFRRSLQPEVEENAGFREFYVWRGR